MDAVFRGVDRVLAGQSPLGELLRSLKRFLEDRALWLDQYRAEIRGTVAVQVLVPDRNAEEAGESEGLVVADLLELPPQTFGPDVDAADQLGVGSRLFEVSGPFEFPEKGGPVVLLICFQPDLCPFPLWKPGQQLVDGLELFLV